MNWVVFQHVHDRRVDLGLELVVLGLQVNHGDHGMVCLVS